MGKNFKKNKDYKFKKEHKKFESFKEYTHAEETSLDSIDISKKGNDFIVSGLIDQIEQTGGPTILHLTDGTATLALKAFEGAGIRAYPEINVGDAIKATITIQEYNQELEGEVVKLQKLDSENKKQILENITKIQRKRSEVVPKPFLVEDQILEKLKDRFFKAATEVRLAIIQNRPIIIRHHNDTDGYSSGYALERAILPLIVKQHNSVKAAWEFYTRSPISAPMYEIEDSIRDTAHSLSRAAKFSNKMPLVLVVDTGSGEKDLLGVQQGKVHGIDFIVVDHHAFDKDVISKETIVHINPFLVKEDGAKFSAGMLCTELARFINPDENLNILQIPAMAGLADKTDNPKAIESYLKLAEKKGYTKSLLSDIALVIDFVSAKLRFMEAREYIEVLFGEPMERQKALVKLLAPYIRDLERKGLEIAKDSAEIEKVKDISLQTIEIEKTYARGFYPKPGKCVSILHEDGYESRKINKIITLGLMADAITIRASAESNFSVNELVTYLQKTIPKAFVEGGGHKYAGSIRFLPNKQTAVIKEIKEYIKSL
ncbi:MAG: DHH family phosphoesterase [Nanoarchaeota archaeon]